VVIDSLHAPTLSFRSYVIMCSCTYQLASLLHANEFKMHDMIRLVEIKTADSTYARKM